jgi:methylase of polypeptide subunit release factors
MDTVSIRRLRDDLAASDYTVDRVTALWGADAEASLHRGHRLPAARALAIGAGGPTATLARAFILGLAVSKSALDEALPGLRCSGAESLGLVRAVGTGPADEDAVVPSFDLRPYAFVDRLGAGEWWILSDLGEVALGHALGEAHVLGVGGASMTLSGLIAQSPVRRALDLGTGCGIQAMHLSRHAEEVVATDLSERALQIARLNAELNDISNIEFRNGNLFEPVAGERFDQIVSNPPFVITPRVSGIPAYEYRDAGMVGDTLVEAVVSGAAEHLSPGGAAQLLGNWEYRGDEEDLDRVRGWAGGAVNEGAGVDGRQGGLDCVRSWIDRAQSAVGARADSKPAGAGVLDAWVVEREHMPVTEYSETWIRDGGTQPGSVEFDRLYAAWLQDFEERGVAAVGFGYLFLRRRRRSDGHPGLRRLESVGQPLGQNEAGLGVHVAQCFELFDWQRTRDDAALVGELLTVAVDVTEERHFRPGEDDPSVILLRQGGGFGRTVRVDTSLAAFVGACDGSLSVGAISDAIAELLDADAALLRVHLLPEIRSLIDDAILLPA